MSIKNGIEEWDDLRRGQILRNSSFVSIINYFHKFSAKKKFPPLHSGLKMKENSAINVTCVRVVAQLHIKG